MGGKSLVVLGTWRSVAVVLGVTKVHMSHKKQNNASSSKKNFLVCEIYFLRAENVTLKNGYLH